MKYIRWFHNAIKPYRLPLYLSVFCQIILVGLALGYVFISKALVDIATGHTAAMEMFGIKTVRNGLIAYGSAMIVLIVVRTLIGAWRNYLQSKASVKLRNSLRQRQFDNLMHLSVDVRKKFHSGDILNRIQDDTAAAATTCCNTIPNLIGTTLQLIAAFIYLLILEPALAWTLIVVLPVGIFGGKFLMRRLRSLTLEVKKNDSAVQSHVQESVQHQTLIKTLEYDANSSATLEDLHGDLYDNTMKRTKFTLVARIIVSVTLSCAYAIAFLWGVFGIFKGTVTYGLMTAFLQLVGQLQRPLLVIGEELPGIFHCTASIDRLLELDALPKEEMSEPIFLGDKAGISVENVTFKYDDGTENVLEGFSHDFKPGSRTAIVGPTGVGKSTLIKLMLSLAKPNNGKVLIYNEEGQSHEAGSATRCNLVYVPQGNSLFSGTVRENLLMGNPKASEEDLKAALHTSSADFVLDLQNGLDTQCFEAGGGLSEGQAQRIAIARALLRPGSILLLDEFSSALDPETENTLLERLTARENGKTMIFITHRERIADFCDETIKMKNIQ